MNRYRIEILVTPRPGLLDPEGNAIHHALDSLGYDEVEAVRVGKVLYLDLDADDADAARERADELCRKVLANPVTEDYAIEVVEAEPAGTATVAGAGAASDGEAG